MLKYLRYILVLIIVCIACNDDPQITQNQEDFQLKVFGGSTVKEGANDCCNAILADGANIFLTGSINYLSGPDMFLIKTDKYGNEIEWSPKLFGTENIEVGNALLFDQGKNIVTAGYTQTAISAPADFYIAKTSVNGEELWKRKFGGAGDEKAYSINITPSNTIFVAGYTESVDFGNKKRQGWVLALSENGDSLWSHDYGTLLASDEIHHVSGMKDSLLLVGTTQTLFGSFKNDVFLFILKKSTKGIENSTTLYRSGDEFGVSAVHSSSGNIFVLGYSQVSPNLNNIVLWKLSEDLLLLGEKTISVNNSETPSTLILNGNNLMVIGTADSEQQNENYLVYVLDTDFNVISRYTYGTLGKGDQKGICGTVVGNSIVIGGSTVSGNSSKASVYKTPPILP